MALVGEWAINRIPNTESNFTDCYVVSVRLRTQGSKRCHSAGQSGQTSLRRWPWSQDVNPEKEVAVPGGRRSRDPDGGTLSVSACRASGVTTLKCVALAS